MSKVTIDIAGAGPAGLAAAIVLARHGLPVRVLERSHCVGSRFNDDLQGLENWSDACDIHQEFRGLGIEPTWWYRAASGGELFDASLRGTAVRSSRPLFYFVRRGAVFAESLDNALLRQARELGVEVRFRHKAEPAAVRIHAGGPTGRPMAVVRGMTFRTDQPDMACTILSDRLAPKGYAYFLVADGQATLATVLLSRFLESNACLGETVRAVQHLYGVRVPNHAPRWGGYASFRIPKSAIRGGTCLAGEAAGFQDALFGFGLRSAIVSGALAALSLIKGDDYDEAWRARLLPQLKASQVNRILYNRVPFAPGMFWHLMRAVTGGDRVLHHLYRGTLAHRLASPLVWLDSRRNGGG
ncbi:MAG: NAD(P)/FAD-dependent oxidoreductase [Burkholderiales bacterium]